MTTPSPTALARALRAGLPVLLVALSACGPDDDGAEPEPAPPLADSTPSVATDAPSPEALVGLATPAAPGAGEPNLHAGPSGRVHLSWIEPDGDGHALRFATLADSAWGTARTIARGDDWFVNWADFPSVVELPDGTLAAHWLERSGEGTYAYGVRVSRSSDGGRTWSEPVVPHDDGTETEHGFVTLFPSDDRLGLVWLDGREYAGKEHGDPGAEMTLRFARIGDEVEDAAVLDGRVCDCCQTDVALLHAGPVVVYRDRTDAEVRDIAVVRWARDGWTDPVPVHADGWTIGACPVNGPAIAARDPDAVVAWYTAADAEPKVLLARSVDGGAGFGPPVRVDLGVPEGRVDVALLDGSDALVVWLERAEGGDGLVLARRVAPDGSLGAPVVIGRTTWARAAGFPRMAVSGETAVFAWTEPGEPAEVRTAALPLASLPAGAD